MRRRDTLSSGRPGSRHPISESDPDPAEARGRSLATGRPGSTRPLSEATEDRAQSDSVLRARNPHANRKLSSTRRR
jgi:hypothetical protein